MIRTLLTLLISSVFWLSSLADSKKIRALEKSLTSATDTLRINILNELSSIYASIDLEHADSLAEEARAFLEGIDFPKGKIMNLNHFSDISSSKGHYQEALNYVNDAIELSKSIADTHLLAQSYDYEFMVFFRKGENIEAKKSAEKTNEFALEIGDTELIAKSYDNLGIVKGIKGQHSEAIEYFMKSLTAYEELGDKTKISLALMHIGHTFELAGSFDKALEYLERSLQLNKEVENKYNEGWTLVNIGVVYSRMNKVDTAISYYQRSLTIAEEINNHRLILTCLDNIGGKYSIQKEFDKANQYLQRAYQLSQASGQNSRTVYITGNLAENYLYMGQFDSARIFAEEQLELALYSGLISEQKVAYFISAQIYDSLGEYQLAHKALLDYISVNDTIFSRQKSEQIEALRESYETEKKEQEIETLTTLNESARYRNISYAGAAISFLILGALLYYVQRLRTRRNRLLFEKEKELDRLKSRFFANISHEFRTPLTLILGPLDDLIAKVEQHGTKQQLKVMQRNAQRLLDLVNQLLDLSKIESGKLILETSRSDVVAVIRGVAKSFHSFTEQKNIDLDLDITPAELIINYDKPKLETILTNLLSNAFKFTPEKGRIRIKTAIIKGTKKNGEREFLSIAVSDTGGGIPSEDVEHIFNRFYQADNNQLSQQEGSGIGLALTKELVELHGGKISAESKVGAGTQIFVEIPTDLTATVPETKKKNTSFSQLEAHVQDTATDVEEPQMQQGDRALVLVVEDNKDVRKYIQETLRESYSIVTAIDGEEGISKALETIPDLIISDVMMPKKDGFEVCFILKNNEKTSHIPIILLTAKSDSEDKIEGLLTRADDYITKPFVPRELLVRVMNLIESRLQLRKKYKKEGKLRPEDIAVNSVDEKFLIHLIAEVEQNMSDDRFGVEQLSDLLAMSRSQLHRKLKALIDQSPNQFIRSFRLQRAHDLLQQNSATSSEIAFQVGFGSPSYFTKCFHEQFGYTPSEIPI